MRVALIKSYTAKPWRSPETYQLIEDSLRKKWQVKSIHTKDPQTLRRFLDQLKHADGESVFAFNIAEYLDEENKAGFLPALLEEWKIPHLGSSAEAIAIGLDKAKTKDLLKQKNVPTPGYFVAKRTSGTHKLQAERLGYPLIVKPIREGGHIGITDDSIVYDEAGLNKAIQRVFDAHDQPALVEEYISGAMMREFSVGIINSKVKIFTPIEIDYAAMNVKKAILSYETAQKDLERIKLVPNEKIRAEIIDLAERTFKAVGARDYSRVDLRMDHTGCYVLEINVMPGLGPQSFLPEAAKDIHSLDYEQLIQKLTEDSMRRQKLGSYATG